MSKIVKNTTGSNIEVSDTGQTVLANSSYTIPPQDYLLWAASSDTVTNIGSGNFVINDGSSDLSISDGTDLIKGIFPTTMDIGGFVAGASPKDFVFEVSKGAHTKLETISLFGHNDAIKTTEEGIWHQGGTFKWLAAGQFLSVKSNDNSDKYPSGTGARVVLITGVDENWDFITEQVLMNGTTNVTTVNKFLRINNAQVINAGSQDNNDGDITFTYSGVIYETIKEGKSQLHSTKYSVPNGCRAFVVYGSFQSGNTDKGKRVTVVTKDNNLGIRVEAIPLRIAQDFILNPTPYLNIEAQNDFYVNANLASGSGTEEMSSSLTFILEDIS